MQTIRTLSTLVIVSLSILAISSITCAGQRLIVFEMGNGHEISFRMNKKDLKSAKTHDEEIERIMNAQKQRSSQWVDSYELPESGIAIDFSMTEDEIEEAKARQQKLVSKIAEVKQRQKEKEFEIFEMGESGHILRFEK